MTDEEEMAALMARDDAGTLTADEAMRLMYLLHGSCEAANPAGLSTTDPMRSPDYRQTVREASDRYMRSKGKKPLPRQPWEDHP